MDELDKTATCPICGGKLQVQGKALFKEHHRRLWEEKRRECGASFEIDYGSFGKSYCKVPRYHFGCIEVIDKPAELIRWEAENPIPDVDLIGFVVSLANSLVKTGGIKPDYLDELLAQQERLQQEQEGHHQ